MADIFISYSREDLDRARQIAETFESQGFTVWWDKNIPPGKSFDEVIQEALNASQCVIVLWSKRSVTSHWVKEEAQRGADRGVLVPVLVDDVPIPLGFGRLQSARLIGWDGDPGAEGFKDLSRAVAETIGGGFDSRLMKVQRPADMRTISSLELQTTPPPGSLEQVRRPDPAPPAARTGQSPLVLVPLSIILGVAATVAALYLVRGDLSVLGLGGGESAAMTGVEDRADLAELPAPRAVPPPDAGAEPVTGAGLAEDAESMTDGTVSTVTGEASDEAIGGGEPSDLIGTAAPAAVSKQAPVPSDPAPSDPVPSEPVPPEPPLPDPETVLRAEAVRAIARLEVQESTGQLSDGLLLEAYEVYWSSYFSVLHTSQASDIARKIETLELSISGFEQLQEMDSSASVTLQDKLAAWQAFEPLHSGSTAAAYADSRIAELEAMIGGSATIQGDDRFVTARSVVRDDDGKLVGPDGVAGEFSPGDVYVFAWVHAPKTETLTLEWASGGGRVLHSQPVTVSRNVDAGYRIFYYRSFQAPGPYEVRLFNVNRELIAQRAFTVKP